jgi:hypothetical protein
MLDLSTRGGVDMSRLTDAQKLWTGYVLGSAILVTCLVISGRSGTTASFHVLLCLLGGAAGWTVGIVATPFDEEEKTKFSEIWKGFLALGSGYAIAKLEDPIVAAVTTAIRADGSRVAVRVALFTTCFLVGLLFTLVSRLYGSTEEERKKKRIASLLAQAKEIARKLDDAQQV